MPRLEDDAFPFGCGSPGEEALREGRSQRVDPCAGPAPRSESPHARRAVLLDRMWEDDVKWEERA